MPCSVTGGMLSIIGAATADVLGVHDDGFGNISITSPREDTTPVALHGIHHVMSDTGGGDDAVSYHVGSAESSLRPLQPADLDVALGRGNDSLRILFEPNRIARDVMINANLGAGDDLVALVVPPPDPDSSAPPPDPNHVPRIHFATQGGAGNDEFRTFVGNAVDPESLPCPTCIDADLTLDYEGDGGDDRFFTDVANVGLDGAVTMMLNGGEGNDLSRTTFDNVDVSAALSLLNDGGNGADQISFATTWRVNAGAFTSVNLLGGRGGDTVEGQGVQHVFAGGRSTYDLEGGD